jgi:hypothetical protein
VQSGSYLGEDDIVRFEDIFGRKWEWNDILDKSNSGRIKIKENNYLP